MRRGDLIPVAVAAPMDLWLLDLSRTLDDEAISCLSVEEWRRAGRFRFGRDRHRYIATHAAVRRLVAERVDLPPAVLRLGHGLHGKPNFLNAPGWRFSLSYARRFALIGITTGADIGVDLEPRRSMPDALPLAQAHFTWDEVRTLQEAMIENERSFLFLTGWTRKEACLKAAGIGLGSAPGPLATRLRPDRAIVRLTPPMRAEVASFTLPGHVASWARLR